MTTVKKKPYPAQVHIIHSMMHMVKNKLKHERWMKGRDLVEANVWLFEKMAAAVEDNYGLVYRFDYSWTAAGLYLDGLDKD